MRTCTVNRSAERTGGSVDVVSGTVVATVVTVEVVEATVVVERGVVVGAAVVTASGSLVVVADTPGSSGPLLR